MLSLFCQAECPGHPLTCFSARSSPPTSSWDSILSTCPALCLPLAPASLLPFQKISETGALAQGPGVTVRLMVGSARILKPSISIKMFCLVWRSYTPVYARVNFYVLCQ